MCRKSRRASAVTIRLLMPPKPMTKDAGIMDTQDRSSLHFERKVRGARLSQLTSNQA